MNQSEVCSSVRSSKQPPKPPLPPVATRAPKPPRAPFPAPTLPSRMHHIVPLGPDAARVLDTICRRYRVGGEHVLRAIVEMFLVDTTGDNTLAPCVADEARVIARTGRVPESWWTRGSVPQCPGFDTEASNGKGDR